MLCQIIYHNAAAKPDLEYPIISMMPAYIN